MKIGTTDDNHHLRGLSILCDMLDLCHDQVFLFGGCDSLQWKRWIAKYGRK